MTMLKATARPEDLVRRAGQLIDAGRPAAAAPLLAAIRQLGNITPHIAILTARLAEGVGDGDRARRELDDAIASFPGDADLYRERSGLCLRWGDPERAARDAAEAVVLAPADSLAKALLGSALLVLNRPADARACLREALAADPMNASYREALAQASEADGDPDAAYAVLREGLSPQGGALSLRNAAILHRIRHGDFATAVALAEDGRRAGTVDACLFGLKGHAESSLGDHKAASESYAEALKLGPDDAYVRHLVTAGGLLPEADRAPPEYLRAVFDGYAERFDEHLLSLGYRIPGAMRRCAIEWLREEPENVESPVLDLGCGTGLIGVAISGLPIGPVTGIDISERMLDEARRRAFYSELVQADVVTWLRDEHRTWGLVLAADMVCYFGSVDVLMAAVRAKLRPKGWFVFSIELSDDPSTDWRLERQGRYRHSLAYVTQAAERFAFVVRDVRQDVLRTEAGGPVAGQGGVEAADPTVYSMSTW